ncbi:MAG: ABC transporter permease [Ruminococcus sp.]|jgi:hypothetical protein|nr:ABC transporter permease [Ruminococcus sp.]
MKKIKLLICIISSTLVLLLFGSIALFIISDTLFEQQASERWGKGFAQISVFYTADTGVSLTTYQGYDRAVKKKLTENSLSENIVSAYASLPTAVTLTTADGKTTAASAYFTGGDFFRFHPYELLSGGYYGSDTVEPNVIVIDETAAWQLFGSSDVSGKAVFIDGNLFTIYAVIRPPDDSFTKKTYGDKPRVFISFAAAEKALKGYDSSIKAINCLEFIIENPVKSTALGIVKDGIGYTDTDIDIEIVENSARFDIDKIVPKIPKLALMGVRDKPMVYPFYENAARIAETQMQFVWILIFIDLAVWLVFSAIGSRYGIITIKEKAKREIPRLLLNINRRKHKVSDGDNGGNP